MVFQSDAGKQAKLQTQVMPISLFLTCIVAENAASVRWHQLGLGDRVLRKRKNSLIALPGKGGHNRLLSPQNYFQT